MEWFWQILARRTPYALPSSGTCRAPTRRPSVHSEPMNACGDDAANWYKDPRNQYRMSHRVSTKSNNQGHARSPRVCRARKQPGIKQVPCLLGETTGPSNPPILWLASSLGSSDGAVLISAIRLRRFVANGRGAGVLHHHGIGTAAWNSDWPKAAAENGQWTAPKLTT